MIVTITESCCLEFNMKSNPYLDLHLIESDILFSQYIIEQCKKAYK